MSPNTCRSDCHGGKTASPRYRQKRFKMGLRRLMISADLWKFGIAGNVFLKQMGCFLLQMHRFKCKLVLSLMKR